MKKNLCLIICSSVLVVGSTSQKMEPVSSLRELVDTERAFAKASGEKGTRTAFMEFIADDGILFRPTAVKGKQWMVEHPLPPTPKRSVLSWQPIFADVSAAGDMGYTTGPWEFKQNIEDDKPTDFGNFVTVWKKQADGTWKFVVDLGISNPQPASSPSVWQPAATRKSGKPTTKIDAVTEQSVLIRRERDFSNASAKQGAVKAFLNYSASDARLFRNDNFPFVGKSAAAKALATNKNVWTWEPAFADVSRSADLGYTYGSYELRNNDAVLTEKGNYLRIWKKQNGPWRVVLDVTNPLPPEQKKN